jgi:hypothetical protein
MRYKSGRWACLTATLCRTIRQHGQHVVLRVPSALSRFESTARRFSYYMLLDRFRAISPPVPAAKIKEVTSANYPFRGTMFSMDAESGGALIKFLQERKESENRSPEQSTEPHG